MIADGSKFAVIYVDPPWNFKTYSSRGEGRSAEKHYNTMSIEDICALPVKDLAAKDCVLLIWTTGPMYEKTLRVINAWGFKYKTLGFTWMKQRKKAPPMFTEQADIFTGMGYWTRSNAELCLLATRGHPRRKSKSVKQAILSPVREHSRKPEEAYERIEALLDGPYIELFARTTRQGWTSWGNETTKF